LILNGNGILNSSVLVRKQLLIDVELLSCENEKITWEDYDCWLRLAKRTEKFFYINTPLGYYWAAGGNMTNPERDLSNARSIYNLYLSEHTLKMPSWIIFSEGKALINLGRKNEGIDRLLKINFRNYPFFDFIKSRILIIRTFFIN
jgi:hypothetical protein